MAFPATALDVTVELALGADLTEFPSLWVWTDITAWLHEPAGVTIQRGRPDEFATAPPSKITLTLDNRDGRFCPKNPVGAWYGQLHRNTPLRVRIDPGSGNVTRAVGFVDQWPVVWGDKSLSVSLAPITASGSLRRLGQGGTQRSAIYRYHALQPYSNAEIVGYWPCEDEAGSRAIASGIGGRAATMSPGVENFAADSTIAGSDPLMTLEPGVSFAGFCDTYTPTGETAIRAVTKIPAAPAGTVELLRWWTYGTYPVWTMELVPGSPDRIFLRAYNAAGVEQLGGAGSSLEDNGFGQSLYNRQLYIVIDLVETGGAIDWSFVVWDRYAYNQSYSGAVDNGSEAASTVGIVQAIGSHNHSASADGIALGHIAVATSIGYAPGGPAVMTGFAGSSVSIRLAELATELDLSILTSGPNNPAMFTWVGSSDARDIVEMLRELETVEQGILFDGTGGWLEFLLREDRYNRAVELTLDHDTGQVDWLAPTDDDQQIRNDVTVSRPDGSSFRAFDAGHILANGNYATTVDALLFEDSQLEYHAQWRLHLGTVDELRYPTVGLCLTRQTGKIDDWLACDIGSRIQILNPPDGLPPDTIDLHIEGWTEHLRSRDWRVEINCSPASPWQVFELESAGNLGRLDTAGSELAADATSVATVLHVQTTAGPALGTDTPYDLAVSGERVTVTALASVADAFTRSVSSGWGTSDFGLAWTTSGGSASDYSVTGTVGRHSHGSVNVIRESILAIGYPDIDITVTSTISAAPTGDTVTAGIAARYVDASNYVDFRIFRESGGGVTCALRQVLAGVETVTGFPTVSGVTSSSSIKMRLQAFGTTLNGKAWLSSAVEPDAWTVTLAVTHVAGGALRIRSVLGASVSNALPLLLDFDNLAALDAQALTVTRSVNGVAKAQTSGTDVSLWKPGVLSL